MKRQSIHPTKRLVWLFCLPLTVALIQLALAGFNVAQPTPWLASIQPMLFNVWLLTTVTLVVVAMAFYHQARTPLALRVVRDSGDIISIHRWATITLTVQPNDATVPYHTLWIRELADPALELSEQTLQLHLNYPQLTTISYKVRPIRRGDCHIEGLDIMHLSALKLFRIIHRYPLHTTLKVYPDFQAIHGYSLMASDNHQSLFGIRKLQKRGEGMEFHQLREYQRGDAMRQVDWKATARRQKLISRDYQDERDQQIIVMLDNGRRMRSLDQSLGHLDHAVNAMALLTHIALKQGDAVGLMTFGNEQRWLPAKKGMSHINSVLNHVYDLTAGTHATDHNKAAQKLVQLQHKRALVVIITNTRDEDTDDLLPALHLIGQKHLVLLATIREPILQRVIDQPIATINDAYRYGGTIEYLNRRDKLKSQLLSKGIFVIDTQPDKLAIEICNQYIDIKRRGAL